MLKAIILQRIIHKYRQHTFVGNKFSLKVFKIQKITIKTYSTPCVIKELGILQVTSDITFYGINLHNLVFIYL